MCMQLIVREAHNLRVREDAAAMMRGERGISEDRKYALGYRHGWVSFDGFSWNMESAFPEQFFPRFPADQGLSD